MLTKVTLRIRPSLVSALVAIALIGSACSAAGPDQPATGLNGAVAEPTQDRTVGPPDAVDPYAAAQYQYPVGEAIGFGLPAVLEGEFGTTDSSGYDTMVVTALSDAPPAPNDAVMESRYYSDYLTITSVEELAGKSNLVVQARVLDFSRPYFNSATGAFWHRAAVDHPSDVVPSATTVLRDVRLQVDDVIAASLPDDLQLEGGVLTITVRSGVLAVDIPEDVAAQIELPLSGTHIFISEPQVDLEIGESAVFFLAYEEIDGYYGDQIGFVYRLQPTHALYFKYTESAGEFENAVNFIIGGPPGLERLDMDSLAEAAQLHIASADSVVADGLIHAQDPDPSAGEPREPDDDVPEHEHGEG